MQIFISVLGFILFISLVLIHELGHLVAARANGVKVEEFGLGLPPRLYGRKTKSGLLLSFNWLPLGGFVKLKGEHDGDTRPGSFGAASLGAKTKIMLAGVAVNLLAGLVILTLLAIIGMPQFINKNDYGQNQFAITSDTHVSKQEALLLYIEPDSPAAKAGIRTFDSITELKGSGQDFMIKNSDQLKEATTALAGKEVQINLKRGSQDLVKRLTLRSPAEIQASLKTNQPKGYLGVRPYNLSFTRSSWSAPVFAVGFSGQLIELTAKGLWHALGGLGSFIAGSVTGNHVARVNGQAEASSQVGGPVAIAKIISSSGSIGLNYMLAIIAIISLTLAFMNVLPIPALDGGRLFVMLISRALLKRPLSKGAEELIHGMGMLVLLGLMVLVTLVDLNR